MLQQAVYLYAVQVFASIRTLLPRRVRKNYKIRIINHVFNWQPQEKSWTNIFATHEWWSEFIPWVFASKWCLRNIDWKAPWKPVSAIWNDSISTHTPYTHTHTQAVWGRTWYHLQTVWRRNIWHQQASRDYSRTPMSLYTVLPSRHCLYSKVTINFSCHKISNSFADKQLSALSSPVFSSSIW